MAARTTIFALSTPRGRGAIAVVRLSGPASAETLKAFLGELPPPRHARLGRLRDLDTGAALDQALVLWLPGPKSFTGEDMAELHLHGGPAVIAGVMAALAARPGLIPAEPGAFTRRAFENGRLDLTAVEGLADLIQAETAEQRRQALRQLDGALAQLIDGWRTILTGIMARIEAEIDFPDEDLENDFLTVSLPPLRDLHAAMAAHLNTAPQGERLRDGFRVALLGAPNVGKSSLLNALARRDVAIVSDEPGTTRDILDVHLDLGGYPVIISDMAGLRPGAGRVEAIGIERARQRAQEAELRLALMEGHDTGPVPTEVLALLRPTDLVLRTKCDLQVLDNIEPVQIEATRLQDLPVSTVSGEGLSELLSLLEQRTVTALGAQDAPSFTRLRHRQALSESLAALTAALNQWLTAAPEILAEDLRQAATALGRITGRIDVEDVLDVIFAEFCIGK